MHLNRKSLERKDEWAALNIELPQFDISEISKNTREKPRWLHFGAGNIFRAYIANVHQKLLDSHKADTGIIAVESFDFEVIDKVYHPYDNLSVLVLMNSDGRFDKKIIGSVTETITTNSSNTQDLERLASIFENPYLQMVSFTITEKGYSLTDASGHLLKLVSHDIENGLENPVHTMSIITAMAYKRYGKGLLPLTLVSMDNCSHNGDKLKSSVLKIAEEWFKRGFVDEGFLHYLKDENKISFPLTMIDKITPRPSETVKKNLNDLGVEDLDVFVTSKNSYVSAFVNTEVSEYLVIEDKFTNGRPPLEEAGVIFTDRESVNKVETMKVTTCLNPLHTALAVSGCLLDYKLIADEMKDPLLKKFVEIIGYKEGLPVVVDPGILNPKDFLDEVINERFTNPFIPDTPARIATDTSQKVGIRYGETIKKYVNRDDLDPMELVAIPLAIATWCRYLLGIKDNGEQFLLSPDPLSETLQSILKGVKLGDKKSDIHKILSNKTIFGMDLYVTGLGDKIEKMFYEMTAGKGAVRQTLEKYLL